MIELDSSVGVTEEDDYDNSLKLFNTHPFLTKKNSLRKKSSNIARRPRCTTMLYGFKKCESDFKL